MSRPVDVDICGTYEGQACDSVAQELKDAGAVYEDSEVVLAGNLITSRRPLDLPAFMKAIMKMIRGK